jgi:hypothetical protein
VAVGRRSKVDAGEEALSAPKRLPVVVLPVVVLLVVVLPAVVLPAVVLPVVVLPAVVLPAVVLLAVVLPVVVLPAVVLPAVVLLAVVLPVVVPMLSLAVHRIPEPPRSWPAARTPARPEAPEAVTASTWGTAVSVPGADDLVTALVDVPTDETDPSSDVVQSVAIGALFGEVQIIAGGMAGDDASVGVVDTATAGADGPPTATRLREVAVISVTVSPPKVEARRQRVPFVEVRNSVEVCSWPSVWPGRSTVAANTRCSPSRIRRTGVATVCTAPKVAGLALTSCQPVLVSTKTLGWPGSESTTTVEVPFVATSVALQSGSLAALAGNATSLQLMPSVEVHRRCSAALPPTAANSVPSADADRSVTTVPAESVCIPPASGKDSVGGAQLYPFGEIHDAGDHEVAARVPPTATRLPPNGAIAVRTCSPSPEKAAGLDT